MRHLIVVAVRNTGAVERRHQVVHLLAATNQGSEGQLVIRAILLNLADLVSIRSSKEVTGLEEVMGRDDLPDRLEHSAHPANEADLLLEDLHAVLLSCSLLRLLVLFCLLLLEDGLDLFSIDAVNLLELLGAALLHQVFHHVANLFHEEGDGPFEKVHALRQMEGMNDILVLFNVHLVVLDEDDGAFVLVLATVVRRTEHGDDRWEGLVTTPSVHLVTIDLHLMRADHRDEVVGAEDLLDWVEAKLDGTLSLRVRAESHLSRVTIVHRVRPEQVAEEALEGWLNEPVDVLDICLGAQLW